MKRLLAGIAGVFGISWLLRKRREAVAQDVAVEEAAEAAAADPRAEQLRARIEEAKAAADDRDDFEAGETPVDAADPATRRSAVHEAARARIDEMAERRAGDAGEGRSAD
jgi:hypothetical protein